MKSTLARPAAALWAAALAAALAAPPAMAGGESGGDRARGRIDLAVVIPVVLRVLPASEPRSVSIGPKELAQGYVDVATEMRITSNSIAGIMAAISCDPVLVARVEARIGGQLVQVDAPGSTVRIDLGKMLDAPLAVNYRLFLVSDAAPGNYRWPVALRLGPGA